MKILITESQYNRLLEARKEGFRVDMLRQLPSFRAKIRYCNQWLGPYMGSGSSRLVYEIDDNVVLKLAKNNKGIAQNEKEYSIKNDNYKSDFNIFPKVFNGSDEENFQWILAESVVPAEADDFKKATGFPWKIVKQFIVTVFNRYAYRMSRLEGSLTDEQYEKIMEYDEENSYFFHELEDYLSNYQVSPVNDYFRIANWGLTLRGNQPYMVILDDGIDDEILDKYYR